MAVVTITTAKTTTEATTTATTMETTMVRAIAVAPSMMAITITMDAIAVLIATFY